MRRIILTDTTFISPFNEPARDLRIQNKPLWFWQRDLLSAYEIEEEREYPSVEFAQRFEKENSETIVHSDNIFFNRALIDEFVITSKAKQKPVRLAFNKDDAAIVRHVKPLTRSFEEKDDLLFADLWYLPEGLSQIEDVEPLIIDTEARERGYYHIPPYMATEFGDLVYQLPKKSVCPC